MAPRPPARGRLRSSRNHRLGWDAVYFGRSAPMPGVVQAHRERSPVWNSDNVNPGFAAGGLAAGGSGPAETAEVEQGRPRRRGSIGVLRSSESRTGGTWLAQTRSSPNSRRTPTLGAKRNERATDWHRRVHRDDSGGDERVRLRPSVSARRTRVARAQAWRSINPRSPRRGCAAIQATCLVNTVSP
jgi:hypothetical protein